MELLENISQYQANNDFNNLLEVPNIKFDNNSCSVINSQEIQFNFKKLKHCKETILEDFYLISKKSDISSFSLNCEINADNIPDTTKNKLHLKFKTEQLSEPDNWNENLIKLFTTK